MFKQQKGVTKQNGRLDISILGIQPVDTPDGRWTKVYVVLPKFSLNLNIPRKPLAL